MKKVAFTLIFLGIIFFTNQPIFAQQSRWQFIGKNDNGSLSYLEKSNQKQTGNKKQTWVKKVYDDGSYKIILANWRCHEKRFQIVESANCAASGNYIGKEGSSPMMTVVPDSVSENYYKAVCLPAKQQSAIQPGAASETITAQIITRNANIREALFINSPVVQTIEKGVRLNLADAQPIGAWYQIIIPKTNETGWLHGNTIKLLAIKSNSTKSKQKSKVIGDHRQAEKLN